MWPATLEFQTNESAPDTVISPLFESTSCPTSVLELVQFQPPQATQAALERVTQLLSSIATHE